jgi:hypothetical protein
MIDLNKSKAKGVSADINRLIDQAILDTPRNKRKYLGASSLGGPCTRQIQYVYLDAPVDEGKGFSAKTYRIFSLGHILEDEMVRWFRDAGFDLRNEKKTGEQFGFSIADDRVQGHIDGVICGGPDVITYPCLWEAKTMANTKFNAFKKHGVAKSHPQYYAQVALYQAYMDLTDNPAILTSINKNTSEIHHEIIPFDADIAQKTSDKAVRILQAGEQMLPRASNDPDYWLCRFCDFKSRCHYAS